MALRAWDTCDTMLVTDAGRLRQPGTTIQGINIRISRAMSSATWDY